MTNDSIIVDCWISELPEKMEDAMRQVNAKGGQVASLTQTVYQEDSTEQRVLVTLIFKYEE